MVSQCSFDYTFPLGLVMLSIILNAYWPFVYLLWRNVSSNTLPIFESGFVVVEFKGSPYILDTILLSDMIYKYFLRFCGLQFHLADTVS